MPHHVRLGSGHQLQDQHRGLEGEEKSCGQLGIDKRGHLTAPDTTVTVSIATMPTHSIKTEIQPHGFAVGIPPAVYHSEPTERVVVFDRSLSTDQFSSGTQPPNAQRRTPDSTFSETFKEGVQEEQL